MLLILITAWVAVVFFGLMICRLAARSDDSHALELAEWIAGREAPPGEASGEQLPFDAEPERYRATG